LGNRETNAIKARTDKGSTRFSNEKQRETMRNKIILLKKGSNSMKLTKLNADEWKQIGDQTKEVREELRTLLQMSSGHLPNKIVKHIVKTIDNLDSFRSEAEERMFEEGTLKDTKVFYK
jgi:hypothetical protein